MSFAESPRYEHDHPLFALIDGEAINLEGHLQRGVTAVLKEQLDERKISITSLGVVALKNEVPQISQEEGELN